MKLNFSKVFKHFLQIVFIALVLFILVFAELFLLITNGMYVAVIALFVGSMLIWVVNTFLIQKGAGFFAPNRTLDKKENGTDFILMMVHKVKTSLTGTKWSLKMFLDGDFGSLTLEQKEVLKKIYKKNDSTIDSLKDLLDFARVKGDIQVYNVEQCDILSMTRSIIEEYEEEIKNKKIRFVLSKPEKKLPKITASKEQIISVMQNLIDNAIKYTPAKGGVEVSLEKVDNNVEFKIEDSGIGIPKDQQKFIFNKFFRAKNTLKSRPDGTGLGLFISKKIIEAHKGKIWFESKENLGTTFYFTLPFKV